jgi:hypothetical protein
MFSFIVNLIDKVITVVTQDFVELQRARDNENPQKNKLPRI